MNTRKPAEERRGEIVQAALDLAFEVGPQKVTTGRIAQRLGLTQPAIYKHFPSKADLWHLVTSSLKARIIANIKNSSDLSLPPVTRLRKLVLGQLALVHETPALPEFMVARQPVGMRETERMEIRAGMMAFFDAVRSYVKDAQTGGALRADMPASDLAALIIGVIQSLVLRMLVNRDPAILLVDGERLLDMQLSALARQGDGS